jgi:hypothetical protein
MNKLLRTLIAAALAWSLASGHAAAADKSGPKPGQEPKPRTSQTQPGDPAPVITVPEQAKQDREYVAALKKCDSLKGPKKTACIESAQRKFSRM